MSVATKESDDEFQRNSWKLADSYLDSILQNAERSNLEKVFNDLLEVNIITAKDLVVYHLLKYQRIKGDPYVYGYLGAKCNTLFPEIGAALIREGTAQFIEAYNLRDQNTAIAMLTLLSSLFNYEVAHEIVILQLLHLLLETQNEYSIKLVVNLLTECGKHLLEVSNTAHNMVYEKLRELLQEGKLTESAANAVEHLFDLRRTDYKNMEKNILMEDVDTRTRTHTFIIDDNNIKPSRNLNSYKQDTNFLATEKAFQAMKEKFLQESKVKQAPTKNEVVGVDMTGSKDIEFKKQIYLILKSSLSGEEAAHKILKLRIPDHEKARVVDVIIKSSIQESTYSKFYGILSEKLCSSHKSWNPAYQTVFQQNYCNSEEFEPFQLRILGKFWGHIIATDYIGLEVFQFIKMGEEDTTAAGRVFFKFLMQELVEDIGIVELKSRLQEEYIQPFLKNIFPLDNSENTRYSINYFTAIGLGTLTDGMRQHLNIVSEASKIQDTFETSDDRGRVYQPEKWNQQEINQINARSRRRSKTPPRRRRGSLTPPRRRRNRSKSPTRKDNK